MRAGKAHSLLHMWSVWWGLDQLGGRGSRELGPLLPPRSRTIESACTPGGPGGGAPFWICSSLPGRRGRPLPPATEDPSVRSPHWWLQGQLVLAQLTGAGHGVCACVCPQRMSRQRLCSSPDTGSVVTQHTLAGTPGAGNADLTSPRRGLADHGELVA